MEYCSTLCKLHNEVNKYGIIETFLANKHVVYNDPEFNNLIKAMHEFLIDEHMFEYAEYFQRKLSKEYRDNCRKRYIAKILSQTCLCNDVIQLVV